MKESNKQTLTNALKKLPDYQPEAKAWMDIQQGLKDQVLQKSILQLPNYQAPAFESGLKQAIIYQPTHDKTSIFKMPRLSLKLTAAVCLFTLSFYGIFTYLLPNFQMNGNQMIVAESVEQLSIPEASTNADFEELIMLCKTGNYVCETGDFTSLTSDYQDLDAAQTELKHAMETYGENVNLLQQFNAIERQKAEILNELATYI